MGLGLIVRGTSRKFPHDPAEALQQIVLHRLQMMRLKKEAFMPVYGT